MGIWVEETRAREKAFCHLEMRATPGIWARGVCVCVCVCVVCVCVCVCVCMCVCESEHTSGKPVHAHKKSELRTQPRKPAWHLYQQARSKSSYRHTTTSNTAHSTTRVRVLVRRTILPEQNTRETRVLYTQTNALKQTLKKKSEQTPSRAQAQNAA
jgi:hypothetical protein